ncbi:hypothetical protein [Pseudomonas sp. NW5]|uniref:hypothetical protein n=1 Tax=Pseudomonas sp. NW5 TaxID=2934934 RepID=UPI0020201B7E|nr:hypothetical protein [Pseudomonas sp. NW5]MCL7461366.1 hypothetical protein [Pseudomonas sp. NW5]
MSMTMLLRGSPLLLVALLTGCPQAGDPTTVPSADGRYIRVIQVPGLERRTFEAHVVADGKRRYVSADLRSDQLTRAAFPLMPATTLYMGPCGPVLWTPPSNVLNARTWQAVRNAGHPDCPIPLGTSQWKVLAAEE